MDQELKERYADWAKLYVRLYTEILEYQRSEEEERLRLEEERLSEDEIPL